MCEMLNSSDEGDMNRIYEQMYKSLFKDISAVLAVLKNKDMNSVDSAIRLLENAQCKTEEIFVEAESSYSLYADVLKRTDLQSIGYFLKEGSLLKTKRMTSFTQRENMAEKELEEELKRILDEEMAEKVYSFIVKYVSVKEEIQFSLGMKTGAKLILLLTGDSEHDF